MNTAGRALGLAWALALLGGCSASEDTSGADAIWSDGSTQAALTVKGGMQGFDEVFSYDRANSSMRFVCQRFCYSKGAYQNDPIDYTVQLSESDDEKVRGQLAALGESEDRTRCAMDALDRVLAITSKKGGVTSYLDDSTAGCAGAPSSQPLISMEDASALQSVFEQLAFQ